VIDRRGFVRTALAGFALPLVVSCADGDKLRRIGVLTPSSPNEDLFKEELEPPLRELGWVVGRNMAVEWRDANLHFEQLVPFAEELVRLKVDLIVCWGSSTTRAAKKVTTAIPIVIAAAGDVVATGIVPSLSHPGGNITGYSNMGSEVAVKRAAVVHEILPAVQRIAVILPPGTISSEKIVSEKNAPKNINTLVVEQEYATYRSLGVEPISVELAEPFGNKEWENAIAEAVRRGAHAVDLFVGDSRAAIEAASVKRLPVIVPNRQALEAGGLIYLDMDQDDRPRRVAAIIDKILRGARPADILIEQPTKFKLGINVKAANALGIAIPQAVIMRADEVIR
jgi:putative ABC transport system substrate-binding protein